MTDCPVCHEPTTTLLRACYEDDLPDLGEAHIIVACPECVEERDMVALP